MGLACPNKRSSNIQCRLVYDIMTFFPRMKAPKISISWGVFLTLCKFESLIFCQIRKITFFLRQMHSLLPLSRPLLIEACRGDRFILQNKSLLISVCFIRKVSQTRSGNTWTSFKVIAVYEKRSTMCIYKQHLVWNCTTIAEEIL